MPKAILHIGTEKTGSSALQNHLAFYRDKLLTSGFFYSKAAGERNHRRLATYAMDGEEIDDLHQSFHLDDSAAIANFRRNFEEDIAAEIAAAPRSTFIFSNEHCHSRLTNASEVERLHRLLAPHFESIEVIVYLRRQDEVAVSLYSTQLKAGGTQEEILQDVSGDDSYYDYEALLARWEKCFGSDALRVNIFEPAELRGKSIITDFCWKTGIPDLPLGDSRSNESLKPVYQEFLRLFNQKLPPAAMSVDHPMRGQIGEIIGRFGAGLGRLPARAEAEAFYNKFARSNDMVRSRYFPARDSLFQMDFSRYPEVAVPAEITLQDAVAISAEVWSAGARQIRELAAENCYLKGKIALAAEDFRAAERKFRMATELLPWHGRAWHFLGRTLLVLQQLRQALEANEKAIKLDPDNEMFMRLRVKLQTQMAKAGGDGKL